MKNTPYTVRMNEDRKITLPEEIIREAGMEGGDAIEVSYENGVIFLKLKKKNKKSRMPIMDFLGCAQGLYGNSREELDAYLSNERASWER